MIDRELENSKARCEIEPTIFYFEFIVKPSEDKILQPLLNTEKDIYINLNANDPLNKNLCINLKNLPFGMNLAK